MLAVRMCKSAGGLESQVGATATIRFLFHTVQLFSIILVFLKIALSIL